MTRTLFITGTDTGVGKTRVAAALTRAFLDQGVSAVAMKAVETGWNQTGSLPPDASLLVEAARYQGDPSLVIPQIYSDPVSPLVAARRSGTPVDLEAIRSAFSTLITRYDLVVVEGAGGIAVPIAPRTTMADLAHELGTPVLIVARTTLGTVNHTVLTVDYLKTHNIPVVGVLLNGFRSDRQDSSEPDNKALLEELLDVPVLGQLPYEPHGSVKRWADTLNDEIDLATLWSRLG